jgi:hypothetical protein
VNEVAGDVDTPEELEQQLRREFPLTRVFRGVTDIVERWYVYREGHWKRPPDES